MPVPQVHIANSVSMRCPHIFTIDDLQALIDAARAAGVNKVTWSAFAGDQREPAELNLKVSA